MSVRFDGRVAVVTGAGAGLGRAYALLLASRGAKVVVNDLGAGKDGEGRPSQAADAVVKEIIANGGTAVADYNSVVEGEKIIQTAIETFGAVHILINNAGIIRDKSFARISDKDWDLIHAVHLKGSFKTTQAAWPIFKKQKYGRIVMTSSNSGLYGNFGQANYSAAKLGLVGLSNTIAIEGKKDNIQCNVIVPTAASRLTEDILPPDLFQELKPELIAPVVGYLCHESCPDSGTVIDTAVGWAAKVHLVRGKGACLRNSLSDPVTLENVKENWGRVVDMSDATRMSGIQEATGELLTHLEALRDGKGQESSDGDVYSYSANDYIVYALGIGATVKNPSDLRFLYENADEFSPFPTYFILPGVTQAMSSDVLTKAMPQGKTADFSNILHGEQYLEIVGDLPQPGDKITSKSFPVDVLDKGSGLVGIVGNELSDSNGNVFAKGQMSVFVVGAGGFGGKRQSDKAVQCVPVPSRKPDAVVEQKTSEDQAALYRLSGDINPLHIDPSMSAMAGYDRPILHGLCSLGFSVRHVLLRFGNNDPTVLRSVKARFVKPVMPGQVLVTSMWLENKRVHFQTKVKETGKIVIDGSYVDLNGVTDKPLSVKFVSAEDLKSDGVFERIRDEIKAQPDKAKSINGVFLYNIIKDGKQVKQWTVDLKKLELYEGAPKSGKADTTLFITDSDMVDLVMGKLNPQAAYMKGKLKITGNIMLTQKLVPLLKANSKV